VFNYQVGVLNLLLKNYRLNSTFQRPKTCFRKLHWTLPTSICPFH